jgi:hypothetical protein
MSSTYRSAMGKSVDMAGLRARNEKVRAVGNMQVNARGDVIDSNNQVVGQGTQRVNRMYNKATTAPKNRREPVVESVTSPVQQSTKTVENLHQSVANQPSIKPDPTQISSVEPPVQFLEDMSEDEIEYFEDFDDVPELPSTKSKKK